MVCVSKQLNTIVIVAARVRQIFLFLFFFCFFFFAFFPFPSFGAIGFCAVSALGSLTGRNGGKAVAVTLTHPPSSTLLKVKYFLLVLYYYYYYYYYGSVKYVVEQSWQPHCSHLLSHGWKQPVLMYAVSSVRNNDSIMQHHA